MSGTSTSYNFLIVFFVALGSFTYGFNSAISGSALGLSSFLNYFDLTTSGADASKSNQIIGGKFAVSQIMRHAGLMFVFCQRSMVFSQAAVSSAACPSLGCWIVAVGGLLSRSHA